MLGFTLGGALSVSGLLSGCGNDRDTTTAATNLRAEIIANSSVAGATSVTDPEAGCVADGMVEQIGLDRLQGYDILTEDLVIDQGIENVEMSREDADLLAEVFLDCLDVEELFEKHLSAGSAASALSAEQHDCVGDTVTEDVVREILTAGFQGKQNDAYDRVQQQIVDCAVGPG